MLDRTRRRLGSAETTGRPTGSDKIAAKFSRAPVLLAFLCFIHLLIRLEILRIEACDRVDEQYPARMSGLNVCGTYFAKRSAATPFFRLISPRRERQKTSSAREPTRSMRWSRNWRADVGSGERRAAAGRRGLRRSRHFRVRDSPATASFDRFSFARNHFDSGRTLAMRLRMYRYVRKEY